MDSSVGRNAQTKRANLAETMAAEAFGDALKHASAIVRRIAEHFDADLAMLFVVADDQLVLRGEYLRLGGALLEPEDQDAELAYPLDWEHPSDAKGLTASVAVSGEARTLLSLEALRGDPSHRGRWDERVYPNGLDDPQTGFGATIAIPLKNAQRGSPRESVLGVLKIERRRGAAVFNDTERAAVAAVARHLSAVLRDSSADTADTADTADAADTTETIDTTDTTDTTETTETTETTATAESAGSTADKVHESETLAP